jgi:2,3-bisphosphoglycerate-independent phosphoglycerate mutase
LARAPKGANVSKKLTALIIMDGFGFSPIPLGNAILEAGTPNIDRMSAIYPHTRLSASGPDVGLPPGQMGNSEVGHLNIGAGRIVNQELMQITRDIETGKLFSKEPLIWAMDQAREQCTALHLVGLLSDGGVHSHIEHLFALLDMAKARGLNKVFVHCLLDGRDVAPDSGAGFVRQLQEKLKLGNAGQIATIQGRYWGMDRDNIWERVKLGYDAMVLGIGISASDPVQAVLDSYAQGVTDEFVKPAVIVKEGQPVGLIRENDSVICFNFRPDRMRQLTRAFIQPDFKGFERGKGYFPLQYVTMTQYDITFTNLRVVNPPETLRGTLGEYLSKLGLSQIRIAETQKYPHVTFFFNGGVEKPNAREDRVLIPSSKIATFDLKPEMSAPEVTQKALKIIDSGKYDLLILNFANCDMVGHTGVIPATVAAVREVDKDVGLLVDRILELGGRAFVTADHGNAEQMIDYETGGPFTAHTTNPVPFIACSPEYIGKSLRDGGRLADIAPTLLKAMGLAIPEEMTGIPLC